MTLQISPSAFAVPCVFRDLEHGNMAYGRSVGPVFAFQMIKTLLEIFSRAPDSRRGWTVDWEIQTAINTAFAKNAL